MWERNWRFIRRTWWRLIVLALLVVAGFLPGALTYEGNARWFLMGTGVATAFWIAVIMVLVLSGTVGACSGLLAETWVADEPRRMSRHGWRIVNGLSLRANMDIDHIAIGSSGVLVVETKYSEHAWPVGIAGDQFMANRLADAVAQVSRNAKDVARHEDFKRAIGGAPVRPVLVVDSSEPPPDGAREWIEIGGVTIVRAPHLRRWIRTLEDDALDAEIVVRVWTELAKHADRRGERDVRARPTMSQSPNGSSPCGLIHLVDIWAMAVATPAVVLSFPRASRMPRLQWFIGGVCAACVVLVLVGIAVVLRVLLP